MKDPARPSKPNYGSGYDQKRGDLYSERDGHGGYIQKIPAKEDSSYNQAHGEDKQDDKPRATERPKS